MTRRKIYFPLRIFKWFVFHQIFWTSLLLSSYFIIQYVSFRTIDDLEIRSEKTWALLNSILVSFSLYIGVTILMSKRLLTPLGNLIERTRRLRKAPFRSEEFTVEELAEEEEGEWYELESAINKLGREFRRKTVGLSREKTELRAIMSAVDEAILAVNLENEPLFYNNRFALLFRLERWDGRQVGIGEIIRSPEVVDGIRETILTKGSQQKNIEYVLPGSSESSFFRVSFKPLMKKHNLEVYGAVVVFQDLTSIRASEKIRIDFVANASHELRTPVTSLKGYIQTLKEDILAGRHEDSIRFMEIIENNVVRLVALLDDLLELSKMEMGAGIVKKRISTRELTESVMQQIDCRFHSISSLFGIDFLDADPTRAEQVLRNLLQNAIRYVPHGGKIDVLWEKTPEGRTALKVKDTGPGIPEIHLGRLFERFYRVDVGRSREKGGTGIGLALVKHIMLAHGGSVSVKSQVGKGSEFICEF